MNIILVGMPYSGKTTIGTLLAKKLNYTFLDLDSYIEEKLNLKIDKIFEGKGERYFREQESICLQEIIKLHQKNIILSLGGGTFLNDNIKHCKDYGITLWLNVALEILYKRARNNNIIRPLLQNSNIEEKLLSLYQSRKESYQESHLMFSLPQEDTLDNMLETILNMLNLVVKR